MFLDMTLKRNPGLIRAATMLHQEGIIPANTYVIDLDSLEHNVKAISKAARENGVDLYYMTKQIGRSGFIGDVIMQNGIEKAVAVDIDEAIGLKKQGCGIGNLGHLVQPSKSQWEFVLNTLEPEVVTLFSYERAKQLSDAAEKLGKKQDVILRVIRPDDAIYPGQYGGFLVDELDQQLSALKDLKGITIVGVTSFPVLTLNESKDDYAYTTNLSTLQQAKTILETNGIKLKQVNAPSATSCHTLPMLAAAGVTHGEPGHAITGTTPLHAYKEDLTEIPSIVYVSEISHMDEENAYTIAGGFYPRSGMQNALYGSSVEQVMKQKTKIEHFSPTNIDYYGSLKRQAPMVVGDTVIYAFRTQIFVTRAHVAFVRNVNGKNPELAYLQRRGR